MWIHKQVLLGLTACLGKPTTTTDSIAWYWSGEAWEVSDSEKENAPNHIGIPIIKGCTPGQVCGKFSIDNNCPTYMVLMNASGNKFVFTLETAIEPRDACGGGFTRTIDLKLLSDGMMEFRYHNGISLEGILERH